MPSPIVVLEMDPVEARALWCAAGIAVQLLDEVGAAPDAPLFGQRDRLEALARRLDHEINHPHIPLEGDQDA
jgi:hypothetical protein